MTLTNTERRVLRHALARPEPHYVCPTPGLWAASQTAVLRSLWRKGLITADGAPTLTADGVAWAKTVTITESIRP